MQLKVSKTDQLRKGVDIFLGKTENSLCPVAALLPTTTRGQRARPLFMFQSGIFLTRENFVKEVRKTLRTAGLDDKLYSGHSFRIGAATTAALAGVEESTIKALGRWESAAYLAYLKIPRDSLTAIIIIPICI